MFPISLVSFLLVMYERVQRHPAELKLKLKKQMLELLVCCFLLQEQVIIDGSQKYCKPGFVNCYLEAQLRMYF